MKFLEKIKQDQFFYSIDSENTLFVHTKNLGLTIYVGTFLHFIKKLMNELGIQQG